MFEELAKLVNGDDGLVRRGRFLTTTFLVEADDVSWLVRVVEGRIERVERGPFLMRAWSFAIRARRESWRRFWEPVPAAGYHDLFAMSRHGHARIEGDLLPLMTHLRYIQEVLTSPRRINQDPRRGPTSPTTPVPVTIEPVVGRYMRLRTAAKIPGARVTITKEIGHFPMSEHPAQFRRYLLPVLDEIRSTR